jgi:ectoine hydroxylase-related dioxygenase (phytanoyl-CoA dioxygenase family)
MKTEASAVIDRVGVSVVPGVLTAATVRSLAEQIEMKLPRATAAGVRGLCHKVPSVAALAHSSVVRRLIEPILGTEARLVRSIFFSKTAAANWRVAWHQDLTIAVREKFEVDGFVSWSTKDGVAHVQPPVRILEDMLSVRLHLDPTDDTNGGLWVAPRSHLLGRLPASEAADAAENCGKHLCSVAAGDALLFRPLLVHASRKATSQRPRRVIHLEFAGAPLPEPLARPTA